MPISTDKDRKRVTVGLPVALVEELERITHDRYGTSLSDTIRALLADAVKRERERA